MVIKKSNPSIQYRRTEYLEDSSTNETKMHVSARTMCRPMFWDESSRSMYMYTYVLLVNSKDAWTRGSHSAQVAWLGLAMLNQVLSLEKSWLGFQAPRNVYILLELIWIDHLAKGSGREIYSQLWVKKTLLIYSGYSPTPKLNRRAMYTYMYVSAGCIWELASSSDLPSWITILNLGLLGSPVRNIVYFWP